MTQLSEKQRDRLKRKLPRTPSRKKALNVSAEEKPSGRNLSLVSNTSSQSSLGSEYAIALEEQAMEASDPNSSLEGKFSENRL